MQIGRQEEFHMGKIADNAEQQKHNNAAPQQARFSFVCQKINSFPFRFCTNLQNVRKSSDKRGVLWYTCT